MTVGDGLESCTSQVHTTEPFAFRGRTITLIDTPGFDDTVKSEAEIVMLISDFLRVTYVVLLPLKQTRNTHGERAHTRSSGEFSRRARAAGLPTITVAYGGGAWIWWRFAQRD